MTDFTKVQKNLEARGYTVKAFATAAEAADYLDGAIDGKTVGFGGSATLDALGIYDRLEPSYTVFHKDSQTFSCLWTEYQEDYAAFCRACQQDLDAYGSAEGFEGKPNTPPNVFNVSMIPWESFDSFHLHCPQGNSYLLPIFTIGRFYREGDRVLLPLAAQVHHAVCDGFHLCRLIGEVRAWLADGGPAAGGQPGREGAEK